MKRTKRTAFFAAAAAAVIVIAGFAGGAGIRQVSGENSLENTAAESAQKDADNTYMPKEGFDKYQVVDYDGIPGEPLHVTVSTNEAETLFNLQFDLFDDAQQAEVAEVADHEYRDTRCGFLQEDSPKIVEEAVENGAWTQI